MARTLANQVVVVTGASSGIGQALARVLAERGARLGLIARRQDKLDELADEINRAGGTARTAAADVGERQEIKQAIQDLADDLGPVDLLVANAGIGGPTELEPPNVEVVEKVLRVNVLGVVYSIDAVIPEMLRRKQGHIAAISSLAAYKGLPGESAYCASKAAVNAYLEGLRLQLRYRGVAVTTICPGFIRTPLTDVNPFRMPFLMDVEMAARRIARALERRQKMLNFPWPMYWLMELIRWAPDWTVYLGVRRYLENPPQFPPGYFDDLVRQPCTEK